MQSYAEVYQRYFDPDRFAPGSPKTAQKELPRASAYEALISLKQKYYHDAKKPLDVNDLPTSAPLFDNDELLNRAEQITSDWTHQHPENMPTATKSSVLSGTAVAPSATVAAATAPSKSIQDETRRQAQNLWKLWTKNHLSQQQQAAAALGDPSATNKQAPRRASDSVAAVSPKPDGPLGYNAGDYPLHRSSVPSVAQQQNMALGRQSISMYDTDDSKIPEQPTDLNVPHQTAPSNPPVPAPAPIDDQANTEQQAKPVASDRPIDQQQQPVDNKDLSNLDQSDDTVMMNQQQLDGNIQGTATEDNAQVAPADDEIQDVGSVNNKGPSDTTATAVGAGVATTAAAGTAIAATGGTESENNDKIEVSSSLKPVTSGGGRTLTPQVSFAENDEQPKKEENNVRNTGGTKEHIAEQSELYHNGGLTGTQPVGKIDLKNL